MDSPTPKIKKSNMIAAFVIAGILIVLVVCVVSYIMIESHKKSKNTTNESTSQPQNTVHHHHHSKRNVLPTGFLAIKAPKTSQYIELGQRLFPQNEKNLSYTLEISEVAPMQPMIWMMQYVNESKSEFILKAEVSHLMFTIQAGSPGPNVKYGVLYVAPTLYPLADNVVFAFDSQKRLMAKKGSWNREAVYIAVSNVDHATLIWTTADTALHVILTDEDNRPLHAKKTKKKVSFATPVASTESTQSQSQSQSQSHNHNHEDSRRQNQNQDQDQDQGQNQDQDQDRDQDQESHGRNYDYDEVVMEGADIENEMNY